MEMSALTNVSIYVSFLFWSFKHEIKVILNSMYVLSSFVYQLQQSFKETSFSKQNLHLTFIQKTTQIQIPINLKRHVIDFCWLVSIDFDMARRKTRNI